MGEPRNSAGGIHYQGKAYVFLGNALGGRARLRRQWNGGFTRRVGTQGILDSDLALGVEHALLAPAGYQDLSFELEAKPLNAPLDGTGLTAPPFSFGRWRRDVTFTANIPLLPLSPYRWRVRATSSHPFFPRSPWFSIADLGVTLTDFRTPCQLQNWYRDQDGDGHGLWSVNLSACTQPAGYVASNDDCDDTTAARFPGNPEICDGLDNDCNSVADDVAVPLVSQSLAVSRTGTTATLTWSAFFGATSYDVVRGGLLTLRAFGGDFTPSVSGCVADNTTFKTVNDASVPGPGDAWWYVVRGVNCGGPGTYNDGSTTQSGSRDAEIAGSGAACP